MGFGEGIKVALFTMGLVFVLLTVVYALIKVSSAVIRWYYGEPRGQNGK